MLKKIRLFFTPKCRQCGNVLKRVKFNNRFIEATIRACSSCGWREKIGGYNEDPPPGLRPMSPSPPPPLLR